MRESKGHNEGIVKAAEELRSERKWKLLFSDRLRPDITAIRVGVRPVILLAAIVLFGLFAASQSAPQYFGGVPMSLATLIGFFVVIGVFIFKRGS